MTVDCSGWVVFKNQAPISYWPLMMVYLGFSRPWLTLFCDRRISHCNYLRYLPHGWCINVKVVQVYVGQTSWLLTFNIVFNLLWSQEWFLLTSRPPPLPSFSNVSILLNLNTEVFTVFRFVKFFKRHTKLYVSLQIS